MSKPESKHKSVIPEAEVGEEEESPLPRILRNSIFARMGTGAGDH